MNTFNKKSLCVAIAATGLLGAGGVAQAVNISEDGTGNVLVYPYYTVRVNASNNSYNTLLSVVNTTASTKAVKIRFREGKNSVEVLDFNVFLSPFDMWTAAVTPTTDGAQIATADRSCTIPSFTFPTATLGAVSNPVAFRNLRYTGANDDGGGLTLDRTREGYIEVFEMATYATSSTVHAAALHSQTTGLPANCAGIGDLAPLTNAITEAQPPIGGLMGVGQLINPGVGASMAYNPVALDNFWPTTPAGIPSPIFYATTGSASPTLADAAPNSAVVSGKTLKVSTGWNTPLGASGADAVSAVLMHNAVMNEYILDAGTGSKTDWVVTFPTKKSYVAIGTGSALAPFQRNFTNGACDDITLALWDREERTPGPGTGPGPDFSPRDAATPNVPKICWEANVITFNTPTGLGLLGSTNVGINVNTNVGTANAPAENGWMSLGFANPLAKLTNVNTRTIDLATGLVTAGPATATYSGLPVVGFNVFSYTNGALKVGAVTYNLPVTWGLGVNHRYSTSIAP